MPEESKKNQQKGKNEPKDQRRRRQGRQPAGPSEKKAEKQPELIKEPEKPALESPGPEFYKNLKRETEEILKITEEANTKYKKKEIQSNWAKYEMPVQSYEEIDEHENMGADYEKLIQAPMQAGGHFQFKHEKSWDSETGPSLYDKYFNINMDLLSIAVSTIPFYERNNIDQSIFNENDIVTMNHRATKFKQKYYNDKKYTTPELEAQDKILKTISGHSDKPETEKDVCNESSCKNDNAVSDKLISKTSSILNNSNVNEKPFFDNDLIHNVNTILTEKVQARKETTKSSPLKEIKETIQIENNIHSQDGNKTDSSKNLEDVDTLFQSNDNSECENANKEPDIVFKDFEPPKEKTVEEPKPKASKASKNPVIESPEDLEKWLDDFLEG